MSKNNTYFYTFFILYTRHEHKTGFKMTSDSVKTNYINCLSQQISEFELLKSMYPNKGEIILTDNSVLDDINKFIENETEFVPQNLDFVLNLFICELKLEICVNLPSLYPDEEPDILVRCNQLNRKQETSLNADLSELIKKDHIGEVCLYSIVSWLQDNIDLYNVKAESNINESCEAKHNKDEEKFVRYWIFSHHIYNKRKKEEIVKKAKELNLTGFCLPGKPGIICVEGDESCCKEWWREIKSMTWKKIAVKNIETFQPDERKKESKFTHFEELQLKNPVNNKHANMSEFSKYMSNLGFSEIFNDFFGFYNE